VGRARAQAILDPLDRAVYGVAGPLELVAQTFAVARGPGRFHRAGEPGVWYACAKLDSALAEVVFHQRRWLAASGLAGITVRLVEARAAFAGQFLDLRGGASHPALDPDIAVGWPAGQALADQARARRLDGVAWPSVRDPARGETYALASRLARCAGAALGRGVAAVPRRRAFSRGRRALDHAPHVRSSCGYARPDTPTFRITAARTGLSQPMA
jgi:hypothetical protein